MATVDKFNVDDILNNSETYVKDILSFYEGWDARGEDDKKQFEQRLKANVINTLTYSSELHAFINEAGLHVTGVYIKSEHSKSFAVLISLPVEDYISEKLGDVYVKARHIERSSRSELYRIGFNLTYDDGSLNQDTLKAEGYIRTF